MPSSDSILAGLTQIANDGFLVAVAWHVLLGAAIVALALGWRPSGWIAAVSIPSLLASVAVFAFAARNPFNGVVFGVAAIAMLTFALIDRPRMLRRGPPWAWAIGIGMLAFGWLYPHFLAMHPVAYLIGAPVGLVPCPTLSVAIGLALLAGGVGPRSWTIVLVALGMFYGLFGLFRLGVVLDSGLVIGALALVRTLQRNAA